jgi:hypothetical protein
MRATLTIASGPYTGHSLGVEGAAPHTVGRSAAATLCVDDPYLSEVHFAVWTDPRGAYVRDLQSYYGTYVNQLAVQETALRDGDSVQAGQTLFQVSLAAPAVEVPADRAPREDLNLRDLVGGARAHPHDCARFVLQSAPAGIFAIVDLAHDAELLDLLNASGEAFCAFDEARPIDQLGDFAPTLVALTHASRPLADVVEETFGTGNAIFFHCDAPFAEVYGHLLEFVAFDEEGMLTTRQFYDPVVLDRWLSECTFEEARAFFGPIQTFFAESEDGKAFVRLRLGADRVVRDEVPLTMPSA